MKLINKSIRSEVLLGWVLIALGSNTVLGWILHVTQMVEIKHGLVPMVFNTGLCFLLSGIGLALSERTDRQPHPSRTAIGLFLVVLCSLTLTEHIFDRNLGIDQAWLHTWYDYGNTRPGRMAPNTAIGFMLIGLTFVLSRAVLARRNAILVMALTFGVFVIGLTGLVGYLLAPDLLFGWARSARMAVHTASGMIIAATGIWLWWSRCPWYQGERVFGEDSKIRFLSAGILIIVTVTVGLTSFVQLQGTLEKTLESRLTTVADTRANWFSESHQEVAQEVRMAVSLNGTEQEALALLNDPKRSVARFDALAGALLKAGYRGVRLETADGRLLHTNGAMASTSTFHADLVAGGDTQLIWDGSSVLRVQITLQQAGHLLGRLVLDRLAPTLEQPLFNLSSLGETAELAVCIKQENTLVCLPNVKNTTVFRVTLGRKPLPMEFALAGKSGIVYTLDYRRQNVIAAYRPLASGLGMVAKQDTQEAYGVIRNAFSVTAPVILLAAVLGALLLAWQLNPLVKRMRASERAAAAAARETRIIMGAVGEGIVTVDETGLISSANAAAHRIFGYAPDQLLGQPLATLAGECSALPDAASVECEAARANGERFPLEITLSTIELTGEHVQVAVMRDISARKELEERLARQAQYDLLTSLPNRALFLDRLHSAIQRTQRSGSTLAVMFLDLDGFKAINDQHGHQGGDELLVQVAERLAQAVRATDTVARLGGDEFTVILEGLNDHAIDDAKAIAGKIIDVIRAPCHVAGQSASVTASIGLVLCSGKEGHLKVEDVLVRADAQMYVAKRAGKNMYAIAPDILAVEPETALLEQSQLNRPKAP